MSGKDDDRRLLAALEQAAVKGERCPTTDVLGALFDSGSRPRAAGALKRLTRAGQILIEVAGHNWRVVTILTGPHAGKSTAQSPTGSLPYRRIDADGDHWLTRPDWAA